jgi:hypothetical protein
VEFERLLNRKNQPIPASIGARQLKQAIETHLESLSYYQRHGLMSYLAEQIEKEDEREEAETRRSMGTHQGPVADSNLD